MFSDTEELLNMAHKVLNGNLFSIYDIRNLKAFHKKISRQNSFKYNQLRLHFYRNNR